VNSIPSLELFEGRIFYFKLVILQVEDIEKAKSWHNSVGYGEAKGLRQETAISKMVVIDGV
jgi:uncharacterized protein (DUF1330 family)